MKKMFVTALAMTMVLGMSTTAFAAEGSVNGAGTGAQDPINVTAKYNDGTTTPTVYSVDLTWDDMTFTYNESGTRTWNPDTHTYTNSTTSGWDKTTAAVTATNHSNAAVTVKFDYTPNGSTGVTASMSKGSFELDAGVENKPDEAATDSSILTIDSGTKPNDTVSAEGTVIGTITVTIE